MRKAFFLILTLWAPILCAQQNIPSGKYVLGGIEVDGGGGAIDSAALVAISGLTIGQTINVPGEELASAIRNLWKQNIFDDIQINILRVQDGRLYLQIKALEKPRISKYTFRGIKKGHADDLRESIKFVRGQRFTEAKRRQAIRIITNYYQEKGYYNTQVNFDLKQDAGAPNAIIIVINIDKGKRYKIAEINLNGLTDVPVKRMKRQMKGTKERSLIRVFKRSKFLQSAYDTDRDELVKYLQGKGYRDAKILADSVRKIEGKRLVAIDIDLYQGRQYFIRNITWSGNIKYTTDTLSTVLGLKKGELYSSERLSRRLFADPAGTDISSLYQDQGYLFFRVEPVEVAVIGDSVDLELQVFEGPIATYDKILIEGNTVTSDYVILRELRTLPGNRFSRAEIMRSQRELMQLGYFNEQTLDVVPIPNPEKGTVDIKYVVEEKANDRLFFQAGWGGNVANRGAYNNYVGAGLIGTVGVTLNNFSTKRFFQKGAWRPLPKGDGQRLTLQAQVNGRGFQNYSLGFMEPWFGGHKPNSLGFNTNYSIQNYPSSGFKVNIYGLSVDMGRRLKVPDDYFTTYTSLAYRYYHVANAGFYFPLMPNGFVNIISLKQTLSRNSAYGNQIYPSGGSNISMSVEATPPYSLFNGRDYNSLESYQKYQWLEFHKWSFRAEAWMPITKGKLPMVLYPRVMYGFLGTYNRTLGVSPFERYYIGGDGLSGFNLDGREIIAGRGYQAYLSPNGGGTIYAKYTLELRQPVVLSPTATVWVHGFAEASNGWSNFDTFDPFEMYRSAGGGIRLFLPMFGLLGLDLAMPFDEQPGQVKQLRWHFMIGQQF